MVLVELIRNTVAHRAVIDGLWCMRYAAYQRGSWGMFFAGVQGVPHGSTIMRPALAQQPTFRWSPVDLDTAVVKRLDPAAGGNVYGVLLAPLGLKRGGPFPRIFNDGGGLFELYCGGRRMPLARWPNAGNAIMAQVLDRGDWSKDVSRHGGTFVANEDRVARWNVLGGVWLEGYWRVPWDPQTVLVKSIDSAQRRITLAEPVNGGIGSKYAPHGQLVHRR